MSVAHPVRGLARRARDCRRCPAVAPGSAVIVDLVDPRLVVALGRVALRALAQIQPHGVHFGDDVGRDVAWRGRRLISLYHPSGQTLGRRSRAQQIQDYRRLGRVLARAPAPGRGSIARVQGRPYAARASADV